MGKPSPSKVELRLEVEESKGINLEHFGEIEGQLCRNRAAAVHDLGDHALVHGKDDRERLLGPPTLLEQIGDQLPRSLVLHTGSHWFYSILDHRQTRKAKVDKIVHFAFERPFLVGRSRVRAPKRFEVRFSENQRARAADRLLVEDADDPITLELVIDPPPVELTDDELRELVAEWERLGIGGEA